MQFGLFGSAEVPRGGHDGRMGKGFFDFIDQNVEAEELGYHSTFLVEHHFTGVGQVSASLMLLTGLAARTKALRLGTAVVVLPWHNPILLAEQAATLDILSGGRLDFGVGRGYRYSEFAGFCMPMEEAQSRFDEAFEILVKAWTSDQKFSHQGTYWSCADIIVEPPPAQKPHPPLWIAAGSRESIRNVAARGCNLLLDQFASPAELGERIAFYKTEVEAHGKVFDANNVAVARYFCISSDRAGLDAAFDRLQKSNAGMVSRSKAPGGAQTPSHILRYTERDGGPTAQALYGSVEEVTARIEELHAVGVRYILLNGNDNGRSVQKFGQTILPLFCDR